MFKGLSYLCVAVFFISLFTVGCSSTESIQVEPEMTTYGKKDFKRGEIELPANFSTENFRKLTLGVAFNDISVKAGDISPEIVQTLSSRLQTEMSKLRRFTVFSAHNRGGVQFFQALADVGDADMSIAEEVEMKSLDLVLSASITVSKERQERYNHDEIIYEVECDFSCEDLKTRTVKFAEKAMGRSVRTQAFSLSGQKLGGHVADTLEDERQAIYHAAMQAVAVMANKLGNTFPVGGRVIGILPSGTRFAIDKGFEHGIGKDQQMILYADYFGVKLPLAVAEAVPETTQSSALIYRWNNWDKDAKPIIKDIQKGNWQNYKLYAVGYGMPIPPEWEKAYDKSH